ncbi:MAG: DegT/DnrJ/EryC1/StrS family aminotransferase [Bacteroidetes bacterium]|nr:DegT/DnrJ/EryC1/StrS family aminotransferase [Bacteroidota bacterium]
MIPFSPPKIYQEVIDGVAETLRSGWITSGPKTKEFEQKLLEYTNAKRVLCVNSGTGGLELVLRWFGVGEGDEVIVPVYTYCATANVVVHCGAKPVFVDVGEDFNIDPGKVRAAITEKTKVIIPVDVAGYPCDYDELNALVNENDIRSQFKQRSENQTKLCRILILSDSAHSVGAEYKGAKSGALCDVSVFSFHAVKNLTTAEGGAVCLNLQEPFDNDALYEQMRITGLHGQSVDAIDKINKGHWEYDVVEAGYKWNMPDVLAVMGLIELKYYGDKTLVRRREIFNQYSKSLEGYQWAQIPPYDLEGKLSSYHVYLLRINDISEDQRNEIIKKIFEKEVSVNVHFKPLPMLSYYKNLGYDIKDYPVAYDNFSREISLPVYFDLSDEDIKTVCDAVIESVESIINK